MSIVSQAQEYRATLALLFAGTIAGFLAGRFSSVPNSPKATASSPTPEPKETPPPIIPAKEKEKEKEKEPEPEPKLTDSDWEDEGQGELADFAGVNEECKLVLVVRTDLGMTKGA